MIKHVIMVDTREQKPLKFTHPEIKTMITKLDSGDYTMMFSDGSFSRTVFERKGLSDLFGTLTGGYDRFKKEILRTGQNNKKMVLIIEGSFREVYAGTRHSRVQGSAIIKTVFSLWVRYRIIPIFAANRGEAAYIITQYFLAEWRKKNDA